MLQTLLHGWQPDLRWRLCKVFRNFWTTNSVVLVAGSLPIACRTQKSPDMFDVCDS